MSAFSALVRKDLKVFFSDRRAVIVSFAVPLALASFMGFLTGGSRDKGSAGKITVLMVDQDRSAVSAEVVANLRKDDSVNLETTTLDDARARVLAGKVSVAVVLPERFGKEAGAAFFGTAPKPEVALLADPSRSTEVAMIRGILTQHVMQAVSKSAFNPSADSTLMSDMLAQVERDTQMPSADKAALTQMLDSVNKFQKREVTQPQTAGPEGGLTIPFDTKVEALKKTGPNVKYNAYAHAFAGMGVQFVLFAAIEAAVGILTERQRGLWRRLRAAPLSRYVLLSSKALSGAIIGLMVLIVLFAFGALVFGIRIEGSLPGFALLCAAFALMSSCFGLLVAAIGKTPQAARGMSIFAVLVMVMLGGAWIPSFLFPASLQQLTLAMPTRWAVDGLDAMTWRGLGMDAAMLPAAVLVAFAGLFALIAVARFRWDGA